MKPTDEDVVRTVWNASEGPPKPKTGSKAEKIEKITVIVQNYKLPSWNRFYSHISGWSRQALVKEAHELVWGSLARPTKIMEGRVDLRITAHYKTKHLRDPDNLCSKLLIDPLKGRIIKDDNCEFVRRVTTEAIIGSESDLVIIEIISTGEL